MLRLIEMVRWLLRWSIIGFVLTLFLVTVWTFLWPLEDSAEIAEADAIICLGAGMAADGSFDEATVTRVARCVELYEAGVARLVVFTGGTAAQDGPSAGQGMADLAVSMSLPETAALIEGRAQSTLQNALYSLPMIPDADRIVLVTEAFHLPRAWASFKWAGGRNIRLVASENIRRNADTDAPQWSMIPREAAAIWFNAARALAFTAGGWIGTNEETRLSWLH